MIFCSRLVFLNVVTQLLDLDTLLNANYFIVDQVKPGNSIARFTDAPRLDTSGSFSYDMDLDFSPDGLGQQMSEMNKYFINYSTIFDVSAEFSLLTASMKNSYASPEEKVYNRLITTEHQIRVYQTLFQRKLQGNGLQILIMNSDQSVDRCGDMICTYLAQLFGADVTFIDPQYRPKAKGHVQYVGDKVFAEQHVRELRDIIFKVAVEQSLSTAKFGDIGNLSALFDNDSLTIEDMFHAHHVLFPNEQLPPGNYSISHMKQLIIGRILDSVGKTEERKQLQNLGVDFYAFSPMLDKYDQCIEEADFSDIS